MMLKLEPPVIDYRTGGPKPR